MTAHLMKSKLSQAVSDNFFLHGVQLWIHWGEGSWMTIIDGLKGHLKESQQQIERMEKSQFQIIDGLKGHLKESQQQSQQQIERMEKSQCQIVSLFEKSIYEKCVNLGQLHVALLLSRGLLNSRSLFESYETKILQKPQKGRSRTEFWESLNPNVEIVAYMKKCGVSHTKLVSLVSEFYAKLSQDVHVHHNTETGQIELYDGDMKPQEKLLMEYICITLKVNYIFLGRKHVEKTRSGTLPTASQSD